MVTAGVADRVEVRTGDLTEELDALADEDPFDVLTLDTGDAPKSSRARTTCSRPEGTSPSTPRSSRGPARPPSPPARPALRASRRSKRFNGRWTSPTAAPAPRPRASATPGTWCSAGRRSRQRRNVLSDSAATERMAPPTAGEDTSNPDSDDPSEVAVALDEADDGLADAIESALAGRSAIVAVGVPLALLPDTRRERARKGRNMAGRLSAGRRRRAWPGVRPRHRGRRGGRGGSDRASDGRGRTRRPANSVRVAGPNRRGRRTGEGSNTRYREGAETSHARGPSGARAVRGGDARDRRYARAKPPPARGRLRDARRQVRGRRGGGARRAPVRRGRTDR